MPNTNPITAVLLEDIAKGGRKPIPSTAVKLSAIGTKPTVRVETTAAAVRFDWSAGGKSYSVPVPTYTGRARWNKDNAAVFPVGITSLVLTPLDAKGNAVGEAMTVALNIAAEAPAPATPPAGKPNVDSDATPATPREESDAGKPVTPPLPSIAWGFAANIADDPAGLDAMLDRALLDGGKLLRLWHSNFGTIGKDLAALIAAASGAGYQVILCIQTKDGGSANFGTPDIAGFVQRNVAVLKQCAFVEAGNEWNLNQYKPDDMGGTTSWHKPYVDRFLRPLSIALRAIGVKVMAASTTDSWSAGTYATNADALVAAGAAQWCDAVATHVYWRVAVLDALTPTLADLGRRWGKPLYVTECNLHEQTPLADLPAQLPLYLKAIRAAGTVAGVLLYRAMPHTKTTIWQGERIFGGWDGRPTGLYGLALEAIKATA